jgi:hypothetical protein
MAQREELVERVLIRIGWIAIAAGDIKSEI